MIDMVISTARFVRPGTRRSPRRGLSQPGNSIVCPKCQTRRIFPNECAVFLVYVNDVLVVTDAQTREVMHDCRRPREWFCLACNEVKAGGRSIGVRGGPDIPDMCPDCWWPLIERLAPH